MSRLIDGDALAKWLAKTYEPPYKLDGDEMNSLRWPIDMSQQTDIWKKRLMEFATDINVPNNGWISVKDKTPEINEPILFTGKNTIGNRYPAQKGYFSGDEWYSFGLIDKCSGGVTHWMPLPEPPKEDATDGNH